MTTVIKPNEGAGDVTFGMTQGEVRSLFKDEVPRSKKSDTSVPSDYFAALGIIVHYDNDGIVEAIELGGAAEPTFLNHSIIGVPFNDILIWFRSQDPRVEVHETGLTSYRFGVGAYAPSALKSDQESVEGVIVFRPGYYG